MTYDPELIERLAREAREDDAIFGADEPPCDCTVSGPPRAGCAMCNHREAYRDALERTQANLAAMADQLEAARREIERLVEVHAHAAGVIIDEQLLMRQVVEAAEVVCGPDLTGTERMDLVFDTLMPAIDAYRAAKGKT